MGKPSEILSRLTDGGDSVKVQVGGRAVLALRCEPLDHAGCHSAGAAGPLRNELPGVLPAPDSPAGLPRCRGGASNKPPHCRDCALKACAAERGVAFCAACPRFPCKSMAALEKTYQKRWGSAWWRLDAGPPRERRRPFWPGRGGGGSAPAAG